MAEPSGAVPEDAVTWRELRRSALALEVGRPHALRWLFETASGIDAEEYLDVLDQPADGADGPPLRRDARAPGAGGSHCSTCSGDGRSADSISSSTVGC